MLNDLVAQISMIAFDKQPELSLHVSQIAWSQHGRRYAFTANLLQIVQRSLAGMSSWVRELRRC